MAYSCFISTRFELNKILQQCYTKLVVLRRLQPPFPVLEQDNDERAKESSSPNAGVHGRAASQPQPFANLKMNMYNCFPHEAASFIFMKHILDLQDFFVTFYTILNQIPFRRS